MTPRRPARAGFSLLELAVALTVLAFLMAGLMRLLATASRQVEALERRQPADAVMRLTAPASAWARRLGAAAAPETAAAASAAPAPAAKRAAVRLLACATDPDAGRVSLTVAVGRAVP
jgi:prepilin-type N-terminal cleavage/methylation domain-containing protein